MIHTLEASPFGALPHGLKMVSAQVDSLGGRGDCTFALPDVTFGDPSLVILLHGVYGSHWSWALQGGAGATLQRLMADGTIGPMVLAMPSDGMAGYGTGYQNTDRGAFGDWITTDVPLLAKTVAPRLGSTKFIGGLSLGGWAAIKIAANPENGFAAAAAHSAITKPADLEPFTIGQPSFDRGPGVVATSLIRLLLTEATPPPIYLDCGLDDDLLASNRTLHEQLDAADIRHVYEEAAGGHDWDFWGARLVFSLMFFDRLAR